jgi:hypothetical protein
MRRIGTDKLITGLELSMGWEFATPVEIGNFSLPAISLLRLDGT